MAENDGLFNLISSYVSTRVSDGTNLGKGGGKPVGDEAVLPVSDASQPVKDESEPLNDGARPVSDRRIHRGQTSSCRGVELTAQVVVSGMGDTEFTDEGLWCMPDETHRGMGNTEITDEGLWCMSDETHHPLRPQFSAFVLAIIRAFYWSVSFTGLRQNATETGELASTNEEEGNTKARYSIGFSFR